MDKETRNRIQRATQAARALLEREFGEQLDGVFDIRMDGTTAAEPGSHLDAEQRVLRTKLLTAVEHERAGGLRPGDAVAKHLREAAFTMLNRFVALKMLEARGLVQECVSRGDQSAGFKEFSGLAPGLVQLPDHGYRLYIESLFDEIGKEVRVLFDRHSPMGALWPRRQALADLLALLNAPDLVGVWEQDETIGWFYQYFNGEDERRKMREESQAPRNSRELAVRNQFFTPRYVVQFLTDNTLGRIWYEMRSTQTALADRCEYMVRRPGEELVPRAKKDPRDVRVLDPACGSGHFLLYAFDLLVTIYEEAQADPESPKSEITGRTIAEDYRTLEALREAVPGLILAHNLHGVDIDPRCAQIAQLALWMRAQKAYRDFGINRGERPQIRRSNIVVAEPLVADEQIAKEFVAKLRDAELGRVFMELGDALKLAGDLGLLLRVETLVARPTESGRTGDLFAPPEERIRATLARFVAEEGASNTRRRLFVDDAVQGVGLLRIAEKKYDVVLMNPPFGAGSTRAKKDFEKAYPRTKNDVYAAFVERGVEFLHHRGMLGAITSRTGFFLSSFQKWREEIVLGEAPPVVFADLGHGVMDAAMVEAAAYCLCRDDLGRGHDVTSFLEAFDDEKSGALREAVHRADSAKRYNVRVADFAAIPRCPFAYWVSAQIRASFGRLSAFEADNRTVKQGLATTDDFRFLRLWWTVPQDRVGTWWFPFAKGGAYSPFHADLSLCLDWRLEGAQSWAIYHARHEVVGGIIKNPEFYFRPGLTYPARPHETGWFSVVPRGCIFGHNGPMVFVAPEELLAWLAVLNSRPFHYLVQLLMARGRGGSGQTLTYEVGMVASTPVPCLDNQQVSRLSDLAHRAWSLKRTMDTVNETSHAFVLPAPLRRRAGSYDPPAIESELTAIETQIDDHTFRLYALDGADRAEIEAWASRGEAAPSEENAQDPEDAESEEHADDTGSLLSWAVGVAFGRFDPRLATGGRPMPPEPEPFDPLPTRSPGMWPEGEEPTQRPDILVDDEGHQDDLVARTRAVADRVHVHAPENLRAWLARDFFPLHIKMYSKSRRKAPIYWQLATSSASYSIWLYIHAFTRDTLFRVQNDYVAPKVAHEERRLAAMPREGIGAAERTALAAQKAFVEELRALLDEVKRVAPLWSPDLGDGVIINFAPLWRLVPHHKPWQKELKATWDALCDGKYDWAHLAMHLWPERVVPKCATDRSLAIAHGLEDVFWVEGSDGKWTPRKMPARSVEELVRERTSPAVKAALKSLLEAPAPSGGRGCGRKKSARRATVDEAGGRS